MTSRTCFHSAKNRDYRYNPYLIAELLLTQPLAVADLIVHEMEMFSLLRDVSNDQTPAALA